MIDKKMLNSSNYFSLPFTKSWIPLQLFFSPFLLCNLSAQNIQPAENDTAISNGNLVWTCHVNPSAQNDVPNAVTSDSTGLYIAGWDYAPGGLNSQWRIEKRKFSDGAVIWCWNRDISKNADAVNGITVYNSGLYIVGSDLSPGNEQWHIEKRNSENGNLIWSKSNNPSDKSDDAIGVAADINGIYVAGYDLSTGDAQWRIEKRKLSDGEIIWSQTSNPSDKDDYPESIAEDSSGIYIVGHDFSSGESKWRIEKREKNSGDIIWVQTNATSSGIGSVYDIAVDVSGIYIAGYQIVENGTYLWRIEKRNSDIGVMLWSQNLLLRSKGSIPNAIGVSGDGVYIAGYDFSAINSQWRIEKRDIYSGELLWSQSSNPSERSDQAHGITVNEEGVFIVGWESSPGDSQWRIEKRNR